MRHALVMGGGFCGIVAARVLSDHFDRVTVVERDTLPGSAEARRGVPQSHHMHMLRILGHRILERMFPGIDQELASLSCPLRDQIRDVRMFIGRERGFAPRFASGLEVRSCSRPLLEAVIRERVKAIPNIEFEEGDAIARLEGDGKRIDKVVLRSSRELSADLFVGATGRGMRMSRWFQAVTGQTVPHTVLSSRLRYCTRTYRVPSGLSQTLDADVVVNAEYPSNPRSGALLRIEGDLAQVTLAGYGSVQPPSDPDGFLGYAGALAHPCIHELLPQLEALSPAHVYRDTSNSMHHYDRVRPWPGNLIVLGDSFCSLNPSYGQGMTVGLIGCDLLGEKLRSGSKLGHGFQRELAARARPFFNIATQLDRKWARLDQKKPNLIQRLLGVLKADMIAITYEQPADLIRLVEARHNLRSRMTLLTPALVARTLVRSGTRLLGRVRARPAGSA